MSKTVVNKYGDCVMPYEKANKTLSGLKTHKLCGGWIDIAKVSKTHQSFNCRACNFRYVFPIEITTWKELKKFVRKTKDVK